MTGAGWVQGVQPAEGHRATRHIQILARHHHDDDRCYHVGPQLCILLLKDLRLKRLVSTWQGLKAMVILAILALDFFATSCGWPAARLQ